MLSRVGASSLRYTCASTCVDEDSDAMRRDTREEALGWKASVVARHRFPSEQRG